MSDECKHLFLTFFAEDRKPFFSVFSIGWLS